MKLTINGTSYSVNQICELAQQKLDSKLTMDHERSLYQFLLEWFNKEETIHLNTSGSTGKPKRIKLLKEDVEKSANRTVNYFQLKEGMNALLCMSTDYVAGKLMVVRAICSGMNLITVVPSSNPLKELSGISLDFAAMVPLQVYECLNHEPSKKKLSSIGTIIIGGGEPNLWVKKQLRALRNNIYLTYGMTETITHVAVQKLSGKNLSFNFKLLPGFKISTDNRECLVITTDYKGIDTIITQDVVQILNTQEFQWKGRYDNVVNSGGLKLFPEVLEKKLGDFIEGRRFFIAGIPHPKYGEMLVLVIEGSPFDEKTENKILDFCLKILGNKPEIPKKIIYRKQFLETPTQKIQRTLTLNNER